MTTYPTTPEKPITRAEIDRLTAIIARLHDYAEIDAATIRRLRHEIDVQVRKQRPPPIEPAKSWSDGEDGVVVRVAEWDRLRDD